MDVTANRPCQTTEGLDELAEAEESEPDPKSKEKSKDQKIKGRFIIEEIEEHFEAGRCHLENCEEHNFFYSYRKNKFNFFHRELEEEEKEILCNGNSNCIFAYVYDTNDNCFIEENEIFKIKNLKNFHDNPLYSQFKYIELYAKELEVIDCKKKPDRDFSENIPDIDYAMIIQEETLENENEVMSKSEYNLEKPLLTIPTDEYEVYSEIKYSFPLNAKEGPYSKPSGKERRYSSFNLNFKDNFVSPSCSPIHSPKSKKHELFKTNFFLKNRNKNYKKIKNLIKSIDNSFNLEEKYPDTLYKTSTGTYFREKRLYSVDNRIDVLKKLEIDVNQIEIEENVKEETMRESEFQILHRKEKNCISTNNLCFTNLTIEHTNSLLIEVNNQNKLALSSNFLESTSTSEQLGIICESCLSKGKSVELINK